jgi:ABC-type multidrug transport system fused ATPase/permease subunit
MKVITTVFKTIATLTHAEKLRLIAYTCVQALLGFLDLLGIVAFGLVASLATSSYLNLPQGKFSSFWIDRINVLDLSIGSLIAALVLVILIFFIAKTLLALYISKKMFHFLSKVQNQLSKKLFVRVLNSDFSWFDRQSHSNIAQVITRGSTSAITIQIGNSALLVSDLVLIIFFLSLLFALNIYVALFFMVYILVVFYVLNLMIGGTLSRIHSNLVDLEVHFQSDLRQSFKLFREIRISGRQEFFADELEEVTKAQAFYSAEDTWIQQIPKYALEIALVLGAVLLMLATQLMGGAQDSIPVISVYLIGAARIFPTLLRVQSSFISLKSNQALADNVHDLLEKTATSVVSSTKASHEKLMAGHTKTADIYIDSLRFRYAGMNHDVLKNVSLVIPFGQKVAVIGSSGCGKSTFCDILLGIKEPSSGRVTIGDIEISRWINLNPGFFSYIPQEFSLVANTIQNNISIFSDKSVSDENLKQALEAAHLDSFVSQLPQKLDTRLGDDEIKLSGGQQQRLAIARALYSQPLVCIFDEVTSALDPITEKSIVSDIINLSRPLTTIFITHRISAIRDFERIIFLGDGEVIGDGTYADLSLSCVEFQQLLASSDQ